MYNQENLNIGDLVVAKIKDINDYGVNVVLLEYNNMRGFINLREISSEKYKFLKKVLKIGDIEVIRVIGISDDIVNLSRKHIDKGESTCVYKKYLLVNRIHNIIKFSNFEEYIKNVYLDNFRESNYDIERVDQTSDIHKYVTEKLFKKEIKKIQTTVISDIPFFENITYLKAYIKFLELYYPITIEKNKNSYTVKSNNQLYELEFVQMMENFNNRNNDPEFNYNKEWFLWEAKKFKYSHLVELPQSSGIQPILNIGIVGHVAHGKTSLIESLTGVDTRKYKKEIESNCTIKLGYTNIIITKCECDCEIKYINKKCSGNCNSVYMSIVDCPGHNALLSTMISGANVMDSVIMIIASNEPCPQVQTKEHLRIMEIVNETKNNLIVHTKIDLVSAETSKESLVKVKKFIKDTFLEGSNIIPVSSIKQYNIESILKHLYNVGHDSLEKDNGNETQALIIRNFDINKQGVGYEKMTGLILGCSILKGELTIGQEIMIVPECIKTVVKNIKTDNQNLTRAISGGLIAIETDINPNINLVDSIIIEPKDFDSNLLYKSGSILKLRVHLFKKSKLTFVKTDKIVFNIMGKNTECIVESVNKNKITLILNNDIYIPKNIMKGALIHDKRLVGYACLRTLQAPFEESFESYLQKHSESKVNDFDEECYMKSLEDYYKKDFGRIILPVIRVEYQNTYSSILNFNKLCKKLCVKDIILGEYIRSELGLKSFSIRENILHLKGRTDSIKVSKIITNYANEHKCKRCNSIETNNIKVMNVTKLHCNQCEYIF